MWRFNPRGRYEGRKKGKEGGREGGREIGERVFFHFVSSINTFLSSPPPLSSYLIKAGQRVRLAVAGSNPKDFLPLRLGEGVSSYELTLYVDIAAEGQGGGGGGGGGGGEANIGGIGLSRLVLPTLTKGDGGAGNGDGK
jgi:hypothetical protein